MKSMLAAALLLSISWVSCQNNGSDKAAAPADAPAPQPQHQHTMAPATKTDATFTAEMVSNQKDFVCEMPVSAGISDTCHYEGKAYGFCSHDCMLEFQADPKKYLSAK